MGRNDEVAEITILVGKRKRKSGCLGCLGLVLLGLILLGVLCSLGEKENEKTSAPPSEPISEPTRDETVVPPESTFDDKIEVKFTYPMREWVDVKGNKLKARFVKFDGENVVLFVAGGKEKSFNRHKFSLKDANYLEGISKFPEKIEVRKGVKERTWTYISGRKPFSAVLLTETYQVVLLQEKKRTELHCRQDFSVDDLMYLQTIEHGILP